jgi:CRISPR/Cas system-associated protein Cas5 (RAMP superfamily)
MGTGVLGGVAGAMSKKMKKDFNNAVSETKKNFGIAEKKKPAKKNTMDFGGKKKKAEAPMYESKGTKGGVKMKMAKGYSAGGQIFTGR